MPTTQKHFFIAKRIVSNSLHGIRRDWLRIGCRIRVRHGMGMRLRLGIPRAGVDLYLVDFIDLIFEPDLAVAAIAAGGALFTEVISTGILRAFHANAVRLFFTNIADKWHGCSHWVTITGRVGG